MNPPAEADHRTPSTPTRPEQAAELRKSLPQNITETPTRSGASQVQSIGRG
jgi:hypothetical protein